MKNEITANIPAQALRDISYVLNPDLSQSVHDGDASLLLWHCFLQLCTYFAIKPENTSPPHNSSRQYLDELCEQNRLRNREIEVSNLEGLNYDSGPIIGFLKEGGEAVALIPDKKGGYSIYIPKDHIYRKFKPSDLAILSNKALMFYQSLPDKILTWANLIQFVFGAVNKDFKRICIFQFLITCLGLLLPVVTGIILDSTVPNADTGTLTQFVFALLINTLVISLYNISLVVANIRLRMLSNSQLQAALWDRLLRLPLSFFRQNDTGDLADRMGGKLRLKNSSIYGLYLFTMGK